MSKAEFFTTHPLFFAYLWTNIAAASLGISVTSIAFILQTCIAGYRALNGRFEMVMEEYVYMPPGMSIPGKVWRLYKALYGFSISPRLWQKEFSRLLTELGLKAAPDEPCLFLGPKQLMVFFYVVVRHHPHLPKTC